MPLIHLKDSCIFFAHIPKTGGTSVKDYLLQRFDRVSLVDVKGRPSGKGFISPVSHLAAEDLIELLPPKTFCFAVVRDPLDRLKSEFRFQSKVSRMSRFGFSIWMRTVLYAAKREPRLYQNHIRPQSDMIPQGSESFQFESGFDEIIQRLDQLTGETRPDLSIQHLNKRPRTKASQQSLSVKDTELVCKFYAQDYATLGYEAPKGDYSAKDQMSLLKDLIAKCLARLLVAKQRYNWVH